jgi:hypothetical protein
MPELSVSKAATVSLRLALAASFLSTVADRLGFWGEVGSAEVAWGGFAAFVAYTGILLWFLPKSAVVIFAWGATFLEVALAIGLICGVRTREVAATSCLLLLSFALSMTFATGAEGPFSYFVRTAAAAAFVLATHPILRTDSPVATEGFGVEPDNLAVD